MKKSVCILVTALLFFISCKKDRTCTCSNAIISQTSTQPGYAYTPPPATTKTTTFKNISKNNVNVQECVSNESENTYSFSTFNGTVSVVYEITTKSIENCELK